MNQSENIKVSNSFEYPIQEPSTNRKIMDIVRDYTSIARPNHWFKNVFMFPGILLGWLLTPEMPIATKIIHICIGIVATCLVCSSNYTINEWLDAPNDQKLLEKRNRPCASGKIIAAGAYTQWLILGALGLSLSWLVGIPFMLSGLALFLMGIVYNMRPIRSKERPYIDVLSESINNPLRLLLGWFCVCPFIPPASLLVAYWMIGAYFMAIKRFAELRYINDQEVAASYRKSFAYYTEDRLLISIMFYATCFALFLGIFLMRYKIELILGIPFIAGFMAFYLYLGFLPNSPTQHPESLYKQTKFMAYTCFTSFFLIICFIIRLPILNRIFESTILH